MDTHRKTDDRADASHRVLVAVHGREPAGWELEVSRALALSPRATVEVLAVIDVPSPPGATLLAAARRARARARGEWQRIEEAHVGQRVEALLGCLPAAPPVTWAHVADADPARTIVERAAAWPADLVVVGVDRTSWLSERLLGAIHARVVAHASCAVLVLPRPRRIRARVTGGAPASGPGGRKTVSARGGV